jgi:hypothetical protein
VSREAFGYMMNSKDGIRMKKDGAVRRIELKVRYNYTKRKSDTIEIWKDSQYGWKDEY